MARVFQAYGLSYPLRAECPLESEDIRKLTTLAKLEKQAQETRTALKGLNPSMGNDNLAILKLAQNLQRQGASITRLRVELKSILS